MDAKNIETTAQLGAYAAIGGAFSMIIGAVLWGISGADLDHALAGGELSNYLATAAVTSHLLVANLSLWILGVLLLGTAGTALANLCDRQRAATQAASICYRTAVPLAIVSFVAWLAIVLKIAPETSPAALLVAETLGWFASRADWIATVLIVGFGPALISVAGRGDWVPTWLAGWGFAAAVAGLLTIVAMFTGGLSSYGFLIVPVGLGWTLAAGVVLLRIKNHPVSITKNAPPDALAPPGLT